MKLDQVFYSILNLNLHFQNVHKELSLLDRFLKPYKARIDSAIDIGCGDGSITEELRKLADLGTIYGLDLNERLLDKAKRKGIETIHGDMNSIKQERKYDLVISYGSLHHFENTAGFIAALKEMSRKYLLIVDNTVNGMPLHRITGSKHFPLESSSYAIRTGKEITKALKQSGCSIVATRTNQAANFWHDRSFFLANTCMSNDDRKDKAAEEPDSTEVHTPERVRRVWKRSRYGGSYA
ncbi:class I SAM-dependent methyltransferase [Candidatus Poribacteria bacterium]